jgi:hypothetical protein
MHFALLVSRLPHLPPIEAASGHELDRLALQTRAPGRLAALWRRLAAFGAFRHFVS